MIAAVVLAAGGSRRFGSPKQLARFRGRPLLDHALDAVRASGAERRIVVLGADDEAVAAGADLSGFEVALSQDWAHGQAASLRTGLAAAAGADAVVVTLGDAPLLAPGAIDRVIAAWADGGPPVRAAYDGRAGHPVLLPKAVAARLRDADGDAGAGPLLARMEVDLVDCTGMGTDADVDTVEDLDALEARAR